MPVDCGICALAVGRPVVITAFVADLAGHVRTVSPEWESADGLAWSRDGKEIWFTATQKGLRRELLAANMSGKVRKLLGLPAGMTLQDVAEDGRALVSVDNERVALATMGADGKVMHLPDGLTWVHLVDPGTAITSG